MNIRSLLPLTSSRANNQRCGRTEQEKALRLRPWPLASSVDPSVTVLASRQRELSRSLSFGQWGHFALGFACDGLRPTAFRLLRRSVLCSCRALGAPFLFTPSSASPPCAGLFACWRGLGLGSSGGSPARAGRRVGLPGSCPDFPGPVPDCSRRSAF